MGHLLSFVGQEQVGVFVCFRMEDTYICLRVGHVPLIRGD